MFESSHFVSRARMWRVIFKDKSEVRLLKRPYERPEDLDDRALRKKYGPNYSSIVSKIIKDTGWHPISRYSPVGAD
jgi:hypothetical protein